MESVRLAGETVAYRVDGQGPGLVLVHGTGGDGDSHWGLLVERLSVGHKVVRPDCSGSGLTRDQGGALTLAQMARQVLAAADAAGLDRFDLVGFSMGAPIAITIAAESPQRVRSLTLLAGFASGADARLKLQFTLWRELIASDRRAMTQLAMLTGFSPAFLSSQTEAQLEAWVLAGLTLNNWEGMARQIELDLVLDVRPLLARVTPPTLVIGCTHDHMVPPAHARALAAAIAGARYVELDSGHLACLEQPEALSLLLLDFLSGKLPE